MTQTSDQSGQPVFYFTSVIGVSKNVAVVGGHLLSEGSAPGKTVFFRVEPNGWKSYLSIEQIVYGMSLQPADASQPFTIGILARDGQYIENVKGQGVTRQHVVTHVRGYLLALSCVEDQFLACGDMYQFYRGRGGSWHPMENGFPKARLFDEGSMLKGVDGFSLDDLYAVGSSGEVWHWNGSTWAKVPSFTSVHLYAVCCSADGLVYVGGGGGILFRGRVGGAWEDLTNRSVLVSTVHSVVDFDGSVYVAAGERIVRIDPSGGLHDIFPMTDGFASYALHATADTLWSVGDDIVLSYDGCTWTRYPVPPGLA